MLGKRGSSSTLARSPLTGGGSGGPFRCPGGASPAPDYPLGDAEGGRAAVSTIGAIQLVDVTTGETVRATVGETGHNRIIVHLKKCRTLEMRAEAHITFDKQEVSDKQFIEFSVDFMPQVPSANLITAMPVPMPIGSLGSSSKEITPSLHADLLPDGRSRYLRTSSVRIDTAVHGYGTYQINLTVHKGNQFQAGLPRQTAILELSP